MSEGPGGPRAATLPRLHYVHLGNVAAVGSGRVR